MKIEMQRRVRGSPHGHDAYWYEQGKIYSPDTHPPVPADLAATFLREGWALPVNEKMLAGAEENKMLNGAPENKRRRGRPRKKR